MSKTKYSWLCDTCASLIGYAYEISQTVPPSTLSGRPVEPRKCEFCGKTKKFSKYYMIIAKREREK